MSTNSVGGSSPRRSGGVPPGMIPIVDSSDDQEEEEIISLGLQRNLNSILKSPTPSPSAATVGVNANNHGGNTNNNVAAASTMIGANRKSAYPATPAMMRTSNNNNNISSNNNNNHGGTNNNHMRRTPGPPKSTHNDPHSLHHRRTPGARTLQSKSHSYVTTANNNPSPVIAETPQKLHSMSNTSHQSTATTSTPSLSNLRTPQVLSTSTTAVAPTPTNNTNIHNTSSSTTTGGRKLYTPAHFTLSKNPDLQIGRFNALSPNTLQLTSSIDNLLDDDEEGHTTTNNSNNNGVGGKKIQVSTHMSKQQRMRGRGGTPITTNKSMALVKANNGLSRDEEGRGEEGIKPTEFRRIQSQVSGASALDSDDESMDELNFQSNDDDDDEVELGEVDILEGEDIGKSIGPEENAMNRSDESTIGSVGQGGTNNIVEVIESPQKSSKDQQHQPIRPTPKHSRQGGGSQGQQHHHHQSQQSRHHGHRERQQHTRGREQQQQHQARQHHSQQPYPHQQMSHHPPPHHPQPGYFSPIHLHPPPHNFSYSPYGGASHHPSLHGVSPITLPPDYSQHYPPSSTGLGYAPSQPPPPPVSTNNSSLGVAASSTHGSWSPLPEFNVNTSEWHPPGSQQALGGGTTWGNGGTGGVSSYHPPNYHSGMGIPGHASPEFGFHAIPGHVSPEMFGDVRNISPFMPNFGYPPPPAANQQQSHPSGHGSYVPQQQQQEQHHDQNSIRSHPSSPIKTTNTSPKERHRKDTASSIGSAFSGSANPTSPQSLVLKQSRPGLNFTPSDDGPPPPHHHHQQHGWYNNNTNQGYIPPAGRSLAPPSQMGYQDRYDAHYNSPRHDQGGGVRGERRGNGQEVGSLGGLFEHTSASPGRISSMGAMVDGQFKKGGFTGDGMEGKKYMAPNSPKFGVPQEGRNHAGVNTHRGSASTRPTKPAFSGGNGGGDDEKQFIMESPSERQAFKEFGRNFRQREAESLSAARDYALSSITKDGKGIYLPIATHWRVYLELADLAKRSNESDASRRYYRRACEIQPNASQCWLEYSKLEEESGNLKRCAEILEEGLQHCSTNENLLVRALKFYERTGHLDHSRQLLARLKDMNVEKSWKTILEGAQMEARAGRYSIAREWLKYLTHHVPWYGPLYKIHSEFERDYGDSVEAFAIVEKGLKELPRYGPLYLVAFRLLEKDDLSQKAYDLPKTMNMVSRADNISRELLWRVQFEAAQSQERAAALIMGEKPKLSLKKALYSTRRSYAKAIMLSPPNLVWKIWLASGRTEVSCGNTNGARDLFLRAYDCVTEKGRSTVLLECARLEEFCGDLALSRSILCKARNDHGKSDWKVWLSSVNLECRCGLRERAIVFAQDALDIHRGTGRLWAALIQLRHEDGEMSQMKVLKLALKSVPKSGEVWCEGARISLNPFCPTFDLQAASRHLVFAARFTPQYGDSFLEQLRLDMIGKWLVPLAEPLINNMYDEFMRSKEMNLEEAYQFISKCTKDAADAMKAQLKQNQNSITKDVVDTSDLELHCCSANPNYGHLWFQCRVSPIDSAREVIAKAKDVMAADIVKYSYVYVAAMVRRAGVVMLTLHPEIVGLNGVENAPNLDNFDRLVNQKLRSAPTLDVMLSNDTEVSGPMFITGLTESNKRWKSYSLVEKRRILFGSDSLVN